MYTHNVSNMIIRTVRELSAIVCIAAIVPGNAHSSANAATCSSNAATCAEDSAGAIGLAGGSDRPLS